GTVEVGGLQVRPGDLIHGDCHGVQTVPLDIADKVPDVARQIRQRRQQLIGLRRSANFSLDRLRQAIHDTTLGSSRSKSNPDEPQK
ncbi:MAG: hypothetical protein WBG29_09385, partial [Candidatus Acidiferrales bacterium]